MDDFESFPRGSENWNEFEWEKLMRKSDVFAHEYMRLFQRFGDLPGGDALILKELDAIKMPHAPEDDFEIEAMDDADFEQVTPFFEKDSSYILLRQISIGWCNIFATLLNSEHRHHGVQIIFYLGRALAYYQGALGDGKYPQPASFIAASKRALNNVNMAIGAIEELGEKRDLYQNVTQSMNAHMRGVHDRMVDHLLHLRKLKK